VASSYLAGSASHRTLQRLSDDDARPREAGAPLTCE
jgi:hypothetical protein